MTTASAVREDLLIIGGKEVPAASGATFEVLNPATNEVVARAAKAGPEDVDAAVAAARKAFEEGPWASWSATRRARVLFKLADLIRQRSEELAVLETTQQGKPIRDSRVVDLPMTAGAFEYYAGFANKLFGETIPVSPNVLNYTLREPIGVVAAIVPWNFPLLMAAQKVAPALAAGNTVILKPASATPSTAVLLAKLALEAGVPEGVFNVITGPGDVIGEALVAHPGVDKISVTGETTTGKRIMEVASRTLKHLTLELGGKSPNIIFEDANLDQAVAGALFGIFYTQGEICMAGSRVFVQRPIYDAFMEKFAGRARTLKLGDPMDDTTQIGPLVSRRQREKVLGYIESGKQEGAELIAGGSPPDDEALQRGNYVLPTVFGNVSNEMKIAREEIFGPVVAVIPFDTPEEAVRLANDTPYGLAAGVWTNDLRRAHTVARQLKAGTVWVNSYGQLPVETPFGGYKQSGFGRENSAHVLEHYTQVKNVYVDLSGRPIGWFK